MSKLRFWTKSPVGEAYEYYFVQKGVAAWRGRGG